MSDPQLLDELRQVQLLEGVSEEHLEHLAAIARCVDVPANTTILRAGETATTLYLIVSGRVSLEIHAPGIGSKRILTVNEGELLGWSSVMKNKKLTASGQTPVSTRVIAVDGKEIRALCEKYPRFGYEFMRRAVLALGKRLSATRLQLLDLYGDDQPGSSASEKSGGPS